MKILLATPLYPPEIGGPATHAHFVCTELPRLGFTLERVAFSAVRKHPKIIRHVVYFCMLITKARGADVIYALDPVSVGLPAMLAACALRKKFVVRIAGDYAWEQGVQRFCVKENLDQFLVSKKSYSFFVRLFRKIQTSVARHAVAIVVPSNYFKTVIQKWGIDAAKIKVVYSALEPLVAPIKSEGQKQLGISGLLIVSAGRLVPWKGFLGLLEAFIEIKKSHPNAHLRIVGSGPQKEEIQQYIVSLGLSESVELTGNLVRSDVARTLAAADVFVLNTEYEGLSHQLLEAMQIGTPIVTTAVGGNIELIESGISGLLVQPDDTATIVASVERILSSPEFAQKLTQGATQSLVRFTPQASIAALSGLFNSLT